ncbi:hypothetical protein PENTCL1PPCAC_488, partial [Pristionchus entomophagus]
WSTMLALLLPPLFSALIAATLLVIACSGHDEGWPQAAPLPPEKPKKNNLSRSARNTTTDKALHDTKSTPATKSTKSTGAEPDQS